MNQHPHISTFSVLFPFSCIIKSLLVECKRAMKALADAKGPPGFRYFWETASLDLLQYSHVLGVLSIAKKSRQKRKGEVEEDLFSYDVEELKPRPLLFHVL